ncbi:unnamed protein product [Cylicocyclus nassatus]|uniref:Secreted protein n=1 Tax=Cylicocyclus nassatus TaxID=53992 RepID=A0AA36MCU5_CYLNA|nr:unnamed protein product [Cylicocyclus nassatus]
MEVILTLLILSIAVFQQNYCVPIAVATSGQVEAKGEIAVPPKAAEGHRVKRARHTKCWLYCRNSNPSSCEQRCSVPVGDRNPFGRLFG